MEFLQAKDGILYAGSDPMLLRGMGLGGWLLPEGYMWKFYTKCDRPRRMEALIRDLCGPDYAQTFWERYYDTYITEKDIAWIAEQGLNSVRLPLNARHLFSVSAEGTVEFDKSVLKYVDACVAWCKKHGIYLILDMHGAPGGQTGQNIDDSEADIPELFTKVSNQDMLVQMWHMLASRYAQEPAVGGYDLLNEPICKWNSQYYPQLLPLYRRIIAAVRKVDRKHLVILEGVHWSTDFSVFENFTPEEAADNIMLEFHKYWNDPDEESLTEFVAAANRLRVPLWMGEGGENNCQWYTTVFPMYERLGIGWCFWSYKKMDIANSPAVFAKPSCWDELLAYLDGGARPSPEAAKRAFDAFLVSIGNTAYHPEIVDALLRRPHVEIPASAFDTERITSHRQAGVTFRMTSNATLLFADGHTGEADWRRYGGEPQPDEQTIHLHLFAGDAVGYRISGGLNDLLTVTIRGQGEGNLTICGIPAKVNSTCGVPVPADNMIWVECTGERTVLESLVIGA